MRKIFVGALAICMHLPVVAAAQQSELSVFLFGRVYNDGVRAVQVGAGHLERRSHAAIFEVPARIRIAQEEVLRSPVLQDALARREIKVHNVLWVQTAANGGKVIYYR